MAAQIVVTLENRQFNQNNQIKPIVPRIHGDCFAGRHQQKSGKSVAEVPELQECDLDRLTGQCGNGRENGISPLFPESIGILFPKGRWEKYRDKSPPG